MKSRKQSGFTLVEIAVVLVLIGLLLGGILKGQQLISSARVRNMADQNSGIQAAYYGFIDRFRQVPGDMPAALACRAITAEVDVNCGGTPTIGGNQNGRIDQWEEAGAAWAHLAHSRLLNGSYNGDTTTAAQYEAGVLTGQVPGNAFQQPVLLGFTDDYDDGGAAAGSTVRLAYVFGAGVTPALLRELDVKLDDGDPGSGVVRGAVSTAKTGESTVGGDDFGAGTAGSEVILWSSATGAPCINNADATGSYWNVDSDNTRCNALFLY